MARRTRPRLPAPRAGTIPQRINVPDALHAKLPPLREIPPPAAGLVLPMPAAGAADGVRSYAVRAYRCGELSILVTKESGRLHVSIAHPTRLPSWEEMSGIWYRIATPEQSGVIVLPRPADYVNLHSFCMQIFEYDAAKISGDPGHDL